MTGVPRPDREDPLFSPFWDGTDRAELRIQECSACGRVRWPPRPGCVACHSPESTWVAVAGRGRLFSWVGVDHQTVSGLPTPYTIGLVELTDVPIRMLGRLEGIDRSEVVIGMPLAARFAPSDSGVTLVNWVPVEAHDE